jgi:Rod binding domain-containing protein
MKLDPNTSLAIMQAAQTDVAAKAAEVKRAAKQEAQLDAVAKDFEAMFMTEMLKPMFEQIKPDAIFGGGKGEEIFQGFMLQEYGKLIAETGQVGIADAVKSELIQLQAEASGQRPLEELN